MIKAVLFISTKGEGYADSVYDIETEYRPMIGDIYFVSGILGTVHGLEVESIVLVGKNTIHAYCKLIKSDETKPLGMPGNKGSLITHTKHQIEDFSDRYEVE